MAQAVTDLLTHDEFNAAMPGLFSARTPGGGGGGDEFAVSFAPKAGPTDSHDEAAPVSKRLRAGPTDPHDEAAPVSKRLKAAPLEPVRTLSPPPHVEPAPMQSRMQSRSATAKCGGLPPLEPVLTLSETETAVEAVLSTVGAGEVNWEAIEDLRLWEPDRGLSDLAPALQNGACEAIDSLSPER